MVAVIIVFLLASESSFAVDVAIEQDVSKEYARYMDSRDSPSRVRLQSNGARREVAEVVLLQKALKLGGFTESVDFVPVSASMSKSIERVRSGELALFSTALWSQAFNSQDLLISDCWVDGFEVAIYINPKRQPPVSVSSLEDFRLLETVTHADWLHDVELLSLLQVQRIHKTSTWESMMKMLLSDRVDFILAPFLPGDDLSFYVSPGAYLEPIDGVKVWAKRPRCWPVSAKHPKGPEMFTALNKGLALLREQGRIEELKTDAGMINPGVSDWKLLNVEHVSPYLGRSQVLPRTDTSVEAGKP